MTPRNKMTQQGTAKHHNCRTNDILEDHGNWLLVDISTPKHHGATMAVDKCVFEAHDGGRIHAWKSKNTTYIYAMYNLNRVYTYFHRDVIRKENYQTDHIKHGTLTFIDNRISNLRLVSSSQNAMNRKVRCDSKSGITGVVWDSEHDIWSASISVNGKMVRLGRYDNIDFAIGARKQAEREIYGEYAFEAEDCNK